MNEQEAKEERAFLHDLASPLSTLLFLLDIIMADIKKKSGETAPELEKIKQSLELVDRIKKLLEQRRETVINRTSK